MMQFVVLFDKDQVAISGKCNYFGTRNFSKRAKTKNKNI